MSVFPFIEAEKLQQRNVVKACELLEVSRSTFYHLAPALRVAEDGDLVGAQWLEVCEKSCCDRELCSRAPRRPGSSPQPASSILCPQRASNTASSGWGEASLGVHRASSSCVAAWHSGRLRGGCRAARHRGLRRPRRARLSHGPRAATRGGRHEDPTRSFAWRFSAWPWSCKTLCARTWWLATPCSPITQRRCTSR